MSRCYEKLVSIAVKRTIIKLFFRDYLLHPPLDHREIKIGNRNDEKLQDETEKKEKKIKEMSDSRVKKFHKLFHQQISQHEVLINYYSCALIADILLQGHLYISENFFAFYSNVFGYVTKLVIPVRTVVNIKREKTAKLFPNVCLKQVCPTILFKL